MRVDEHRVASAGWREAVTDLVGSGATMLDFLTAVDEPGDDEIEIVVHLADVVARHRHLVRTRIARTDPHLESVVDVVPGAAWHEREVHELFGVRFDGNPDLRPLLTDGSLNRPLLRTTPLPRRVETPWPGAKDPADRPAPRPGASPVGKVAARPRSRPQPPGIPAEWDAAEGPPA